MQRIERLNLISRLAKNKADLAAKRYSEALNYLNKENERLEELRGYRKDYHNSFTSLIDKGPVNSAKVQLDNQFYRSLQYIIKRQRYTIATIEQEVKRRKEVYLAFYRQITTLNEYIERLKRDAKAEFDANEQKMLDTLVNDIYGSRSNNQE